MVLWPNLSFLILLVYYLHLVICLWSPKTKQKIFVWFFVIFNFLLSPVLFSIIPSHIRWGLLVFLSVGIFVCSSVILLRSELNTSLTALYSLNLILKGFHSHSYKIPFYGFPRDTFSIYFTNCFLIFPDVFRCLVLFNVNKCTVFFFYFFYITLTASFCRFPLSSFLCLSIIFL